MENAMTMLAVGSKFPVECRYSSDGVVTDVFDDGITVRVYLDNPTTDELHNFKDGSKFNMGFVEKDGIIFFMYRFGTMHAMDSPYSMNLCSKVYELCELEDESMGYALTICVIDRSTNILKSMRIIGLQHDFSKKIKAAIDNQVENGLRGKREIQIKISQLYDRYTIYDMVVNTNRNGNWNT